MTVDNACTMSCISHFPSIQIPTSQAGHHLGLRVLAYYLIYFPSLDVMSAYPLVVHCLVNNIYIIITGRDTSVPGKSRYDWLLRIALRLVGSVTPILAAMGMANLIYVITYGGLSGFIVCYFFPAVLQLISIRKCKKTFAEPTHGRIQDGKNTSYIFPPTRNEDHNSDNEVTPLLQRWNMKSETYMTPYSIPILSHPLFVWFMTGLLVGIFGLVVASIFVHADQMQCIKNLF